MNFKKLIAKNIDLTSNPTEIVVDELNKKAYVASIGDESLSVIDLETMTMKEKIQLVGAPQKMSLSPDSSKLAYTDVKTSNIYVLDLVNGYENKLITKLPNVTEIILKNNVIYMISRTNPQLRIVHFDLLQDNDFTKTKKQRKKDIAVKNEQKADAETLTDDLITDYNLQDDKKAEDEEPSIETSKTYSTSIKDINVGQKPIDICERNGNVYVLCAGDNTVYTYNASNDNLKVNKLPIEGFSKSFAPVPNSNLAVVTNMVDLKYVVYDMDKDAPVQTLPINEHINMITILDRTHE